MNRQVREPKYPDMYKAILKLKTIDECVRFFDDLCTVKELQSMEQRFEVARLLDDGMIYNDILEKTGASSATISRVNRSLRYGSDGYRIALDRMQPRNAAGNKDAAERTDLTELAEEDIK